MCVLRALTYTVNCSSHKRSSSPGSHGLKHHQIKESVIEKVIQSSIINEWFTLSQKKKIRDLIKKATWKWVGRKKEKERNSPMRREGDRGQGGKDHSILRIRIDDTHCYLGPRRSPSTPYFCFQQGLR